MSDLTKWWHRSLPTLHLFTGRTTHNYSWAKTTEKLQKHGEETETPPCPTETKKECTWMVREATICLSRCPFPRPVQHHVEGKEKDCKHNSNWEYMHKPTLSLTSLWKELWVNLFEGFFINNTAGAFLEKVVEKQFEQSIQKTNFLHIFKQRGLQCRAAPRKPTTYPLLQRM